MPLTPDQRRLVEDHLWLPEVVLFKGWGNRRIDYDERIQDGMVGLIQAAQRWEDERGATFVSYAWRRARGSIVDGIRTRDKSRSKRGLTMVPLLPRVGGVVVRDSHAVADWVEDKSQALHVEGFEDDLADRLGVQRALPAALATLSPKLREVADGIAAGKQQKQMAVELGISPDAVAKRKQHLAWHLRTVLQGWETA